MGETLKYCSDIESSLELDESEAIWYWRMVKKAYVSYLNLGNYFGYSEFWDLFTF